MFLFDLMRWCTYYRLPIQPYFLPTINYWIKKFISVNRSTVTGENVKKNLNIYVCNNDLKSRLYPWSILLSMCLFLIRLSIMNLCFPYEVRSFAIVYLGQKWLILAAVFMHHRSNIRLVFSFGSWVLMESWRNKLDLHDGI